MEIKELELNMGKQRKGIIKVYLISQQNNIPTYNLIIDEFIDKYEIIDINEQKMNLIDVSSFIYEFVISKYFNNEK